MQRHSYCSTAEVRLRSRILTSSSEMRAQARCQSVGSEQSKGDIVGQVAHSYTVCSDRLGGHYIPLSAPRLLGAPVFAGRALVTRVDIK